MWHHSVEPHREPPEARLGQKFMGNTAVKTYKAEFLEFSQYLSRENYENIENLNIVLSFHIHKLKK